ncbi:MAG: lytic murein transglycosylase [Rickettsiales bacterium]|nr:lytic murein transglycosylase [Rickettsiales bacterium]
MACANELVPPNPVPFGMWLDELKAQAKSQGISQSNIDRIFKNMKPHERVIELDRKQPEGTKTLTQYLTGSVTASRVNKGRALLKKHSAILNKISKEFGVQPRFIVALWGTETSYGGYTGNMDTIRSLMTLAYDGRRSEFFRDELLKALRIIEEGHISYADMKGSWAGALGQCQFMPSSFYEFAVDYNKDGKIDIWNSLPDVFASIANYLSKSGWDDDLTWGRKVQLPPKFDMAFADGQMRFTLADWSNLGVRKANGAPLPQKDLKAAITIPGTLQDGAYLVYDNYDVILKWNRSRYFATAVGTLSDRIRY